MSHCYEVRTGKMLQRDQSRTTDQLAPYVKAMHVQDDVLYGLADLPHMWITSSEAENVGTRVGDLLVCEGGKIGRSAFVTPEVPSDAVIEKSLHRVRAYADASPRYLHYVLAVLRHSGWLDAAVGGATMSHLTGETLSGLRIPMPESHIQRALVAFLDAATMRIDALVMAKRRMLELLDERHIGASLAAITGRDVPGRRADSGIQWLGDIPSHWRVARLGSLFHVQLGRMLNPERAVGDNLRPYVRNTNVRWDYVDTTDLAEMDFPPADQTNYRVIPGDLLVNEGGAGIGRSAIWNGEIDEVFYQKSVHRVRATGNISVRWLLEWLRVAVDRSVFQIEGNLATIPHVPAEALREYRVPIPALVGEQEMLLDRLTDTIRVDAPQRRAVEQQIALLHERRRSVIVDAVTGRFEFREAS